MSNRCQIDVEIIASVQLWLIILVEYLFEYLFFENKVFLKNFKHFFCTNTFCTHCMCVRACVRVCGGGS